MKDILLKTKSLFGGKWVGEGFAKYPTIDDTAYTEHLEFIPDEYKDAIFYSQKTWYKNDTEKNSHTVFWDTGFIILKDDRILLNSVQVGGRIETLELTRHDGNSFTFDSSAILNDLKSVRSQRIFTIDGNQLNYQLNMALHGMEFQNHLSAQLKRSDL